MEKVGISSMPKTAKNEQENDASENDVQGYMACYFGKLEKYLILAQQVHHLHEEKTAKNSLDKNLSILTLLDFSKSKGLDSKNDQN